MVPVTRVDHVPLAHLYWAVARLAHVLVAICYRLAQKESGNGRWRQVIVDLHLHVYSPSCPSHKPSKSEAVGISHRHASSLPGSSSRSGGGGSGGDVSRSGGPLIARPSAHWPAASPCRPRPCRAAQRRCRPAGTGTVSRARVPS